MSRPAAVILTLITACHGSEDFYAKPAAAQFAKLTDPEQCAAVFIRAEPCVDELIVASVMTMGATELGSGLSSELRKSDWKPGERRKVHDIQCQDGPGYARSVFACWDRKGCAVFAACVYPPPAKP